ncbi:MAG: SagB/ThcOx family dehydrogenase [Dehalococcoidia bacterium]|nr:SagB/ThcOx family dehydrogenase [Dehalococcoidia bacterium]
MKLPPPKRKGTYSLEETIERRRSKRAYLPKRLSPEQISQLLWAAQGVFQRGRRTVPSAGGIYPLEIYLVTREGVSHYIPQNHELEETLHGDVLPQLVQAAAGQEFLREAPVNIIIAADDRAMEGRYGDRAERYICMEAGHAAQNIHLQAVSLGLGSAPIGAFDDQQVHSVLKLPDEHWPLYIIPVGYPAE